MPDAISTRQIFGPGLQIHSVSAGLPEINCSPGRGWQH